MRILPLLLACAGLCRADVVLQYVGQPIVPCATQPECSITFQFDLQQVLPANASIDSNTLFSLLDPNQPNAAAATVSGLPGTSAEFVAFTTDAFGDIATWNVAAERDIGLEFLSFFSAGSVATGSGGDRVFINGTPTGTQFAFNTTPGTWMYTPEPESWILTASAVLLAAALGRRLRTQPRAR